ncbi:MAG: hypothetical protein HYW33_03690 [Candidatus Blackburnbacteria bacterium]|nr:hypothetical protein [Candidatus Blackburnbacteria bacterium]
MKILIDQSGKIEYTKSNTVVAFSNGKQKTILIKAQDKREVQKVFRTAGKPYIFVYKTFAILIYLLIKDYLDKIQQIAIDKEYAGQESIIKNLLLEILRKHGSNLKTEDISFVLVGKKHSCHKLAIGVLRGNIKPGITVSKKEVLAEIV